MSYAKKTINYWEVALTGVTPKEKLNREGQVNLLAIFLGYLGDEGTPIIKRVNKNYNWWNHPYALAKPRKGKDNWTEGDAFKALQVFLEHHDMNYLTLKTSGQEFQKLFGSERKGGETKIWYKLFVNEEGTTIGVSPADTWDELKDYEKAEIIISYWLVRFTYKFL